MPVTHEDQSAGAERWTAMHSKHTAHPEPEEQKGAISAQQKIQHEMSCIGTAQNALV